MKIRKRAEQHNVLLNTDYYTVDQINQLLKLEVITYFDDDFNQCYDEVSSWEVREKQFRIFTDDLEEIKVVLDDYGHYTNVAVNKLGISYYITL